MWFEVALVGVGFALGNILFGHFEEGTPKWKRVLKLAISIGIAILIASTAGRTWFFIFFGLVMMIPLVIHLWWLPRHGINGWTGEPKEKYYELRGWKR
jgi:biotin transporter BioY